jgi:hypothetical protein
MQTPYLQEVHKITKKSERKEYGQDLLTLELPTNSRVISFCHYKNKIADFELYIKYIADPENNDKELRTFFFAKSYYYSRIEDNFEFISSFQDLQFNDYPEEIFVFELKENKINA